MSLVKCDEISLREFLGEGDSAYERGGDARWKF